MAKKEIVESKFGFDFYLNEFGEKCAAREQYTTCDRDWFGEFVPKKFKYVVRESDGTSYAFSRKPVIKQTRYGLSWGLDNVEGVYQKGTYINVFFSDEDFGWAWKSGYCKIEN